MLKNIPEFSETATSEKEKKGFHIHLINILFILTIILFVASIAYWISTQSLTTDTQATEEPRQFMQTSTPTRKPANKYAKSYKGQPIPEDLYTNVEYAEGMREPDKIEYVNSRIMKYYLYGEIYSENNIGQPPPVGTFQELNEAVNNMEESIKHKFFSSADFAYVHVRFAGAGSNPDLKNLYSDPESKAEEIIKRYQQIFVLGEASPEQIVESSKNDEELKKFTSHIQNNIISGYSAEKNLFSEDVDFNRFLFSQPANQTSNIYTVKDGTGTAVSYVIVYPTKIKKLTYDSIDEMLADKKKEFIY